MLDLQNMMSSVKVSFDLENMETLKDKTHRKEKRLKAEGGCSVSGYQQKIM